MTIEIEVPLGVLTDAALRAWKASFRAPEYSHREGGEAYEAVKAEVHRHLTEPGTVAEIRAAVKAAAEQLAPAIVREAVTEELKKQVRRIVKEETGAQTLFAQ